ncbi:hypothetical protein BD410DRAFT_843291 [Rickenella mellea]|uniref:Transmembrane protein n=1 Tax=Rickenella mellea TaxID=50990 RepID=A0A4Y7PRX8_9AGAM|nr:hypothetical protein BD410DRAFT_843291 [Rickenella mellea]
MLLWVHAIWGRDTRVLIGTGLLFAAEIGSVVVFYVFGYSAEHGELLIQTSLVGLLGPEPCVTFSIPNMFWKCWIPISIFEGVLLLLTLVKACQEWMEYLQRSPFGSSGVREMLLRNSLAQVLAIFCAYLTCCIMWLSEEPDRTPDLFGFVVMFSITLCCRLMLRIRDAFYNRDTRQTSNFMHVSFDDEGIRSCTPFFASDSQHDNVDPVLNTDWRRELRQMRPASI